MSEVIAPQWCWTPEGLREGLAIRASGGRIVEVFDAASAGVAPMAGRLALPGLVDAHSHAFQRAFRGRVQWRAAGRDDFWSWRDRMYRTANGLSPEGIEAVSALCFLEMALSGVTRVGEFHYLHHQPDGSPYADPDELAARVIAAAERVGIRIALLRTAYLRNGPGEPLRADQRRFGDRDAGEVLAAVERLAARASDTVTVGLAPHSVRAVDPASLARLASFAGPVHAHVSEQPAENERCLRETGRSPLAVFEDAGLLTDRFVAVHLTWPLDGDLERLIAADAAVCACPSTELDLGDGFLPVEARQRARLCLGSDSHAVIDLLGEARAIELHARGLTGRRNVLAPEGDPDGLSARLLHMATVEGQRALGGPGLGLEPGGPADWVLLDLRRAAAEGVPPLAAAAFVAGPEWVEEVRVGGRRIVSGGVHAEGEAIRAEARRHLAVGDA